MQCPKQVYGKTTLIAEELYKSYPIELEYYETKSRTKTGKIYGIGITKRYTDDKEVSVEQKEFNNIMSKEIEVKKLLQMLLVNKVTPITLKDVLQDLVIV